MLAWHTANKKARPKITYRLIAEALGFNSPAHVLMVLRGKANLSEEYALRLATLMKLNKKEAKYLIEIINYNQNRSVHVKKLSLKKMARLNSTGTTLLKPDQYEYYQKWYYSVIHEILSFYQFNGDFKSLAKMVQPPSPKGKQHKQFPFWNVLSLLKKKMIIHTLVNILE